MVQDKTVLELDIADQELLFAASKARENAYAPYSKFAVGAALRTVDNHIFVGTNMENAAYGVTMCAEVGALTAATAAGKLSADTIAIVGGPVDGRAGEVVTPCGRCRQLIFEAADLYGNDTRVLAANGDLSRVQLFTIQELLPEAFGPSTLGVQVPRSGSGLFTRPTKKIG